MLETNYLMEYLNKYEVDDAGVVKLYSPLRLLLAHVYDFLLF